MTASATEEAVGAHAAGQTERFARGLRALAAAPLPPDVEAHAWRTLYNVVGTAVGACHSDAVDAILRYATEHGGTAVAPVLGRTERADQLTAALAIGTAAHYDDYDDTHLATVIHPGAAGLGALVATAVERGSTGRQALAAFAVGCEAQLRLGVACSPSHYDVGWHITGTCGVVGAAVTAGLLLDLDDVALRDAIAVAASQTLGVREAFGTHTKPFHPGKAAANGVLAALLAAEGMTGPPDALEAARGFQAVLSDEPLDKLSALVDGLPDASGGQWELSSNTFKPYPCGIVSHPCIDGAVALHAAVGDAEVVEVVVRCHPLVPELTGNPDPADGLQARFSTIHGVAAGLRDGMVGLAQYDDVRVRAADLVALRAVTRLEVDERIARDAAEVEVLLADGRRAIEHVAHARGSYDRPLDDAELDVKIRALVEPVLPGRTDRIRAVAAGLSHAPDLAALVAACTPGSHA